MLFRSRKWRKTAAGEANSGDEILWPGGMVRRGMKGEKRRRVRATCRAKYGKEIMALIARNQTRANLGRKERGFELDVEGDDVIACVIRRAPPVRERGGREAAGGLGCTRASEDDAGLARLGLGWLGSSAFLHFFLKPFSFSVFLKFK